MRYITYEYICIYDESYYMYMLIYMYMSSFFGFCFYENLQELNGVRMKMNIGRDELLFLES